MHIVWFYFYTLHLQESFFIESVIYSALINLKQRNMPEVARSDSGAISKSPLDRDLLKVKSLLKTLPSQTDPWVAAMGDSNFKTSVVKLSRALDSLLPGLISFPATRRGIIAATGKATVVVENIFSEERLIEEVKKFSLHSPKLTYADSDKKLSLPFDNPKPFLDCDLVIGAHSLGSGEGLDFYSGVNSSAIYKQMRHVMHNDGRYMLPTYLSLSDLSEKLRRYIAILEKVARGDSMHASRDISAIPGLPQVLVPDESLPGGYLSITPLACGGVLAAVSDSIRDFSFQQNARKADGEDPRGLQTAACMPMVGNRQNLSGLISRVRKIYFSSPPLIDRESRNAHALINQTSKWASREFQSLIRQKDDPTIRTALKNVKLHIEEVLERSRRNNPSVNDAVSPNERAYEINAIKFLARPIIEKWLSISKERHDYVQGSSSDLDAFNVAECGDVILHVVSAAVGIAVSEHTRAVWREAIFCEIHEGLRTMKGSLPCGLR